MPVVPTLDVEKYLDFKAMTHYLKAVSSAAPHLVRAFSIGKSRAGRPLLVAEVTNRNLREGRQKPGIWIDGGHQGWNLLGSTACLELLRFLVAGHGRDEFLTDLVDHTVFYIAPRLAPDEMEQCLQTGALIPQELAATPPPSQHGRQFRRVNSLGSWKQFKRDNRVLVPRNPEDRKGPFYDLYRHLDRARLQEAGPRDFPSQHGDSPPLLIPSTRAVFEFMRSYTNVFGVISTSGPGDRVQLVSNNGQSQLVKNLGHRLSELAGIPCAPVREARGKSGEFLSWASQDLGVLAADCQMWSLRTAAGLKGEELENPMEADETELLHLMRFCEKEFPEGSFRDWQELDDPALGKGEIGGWDWSQTWLNPPSGPYLGRELKKLSRLALGLAAASPRIALGEVKETVVGWGDDNNPLRKVDLVVENRGYMPTCPMETGRDMKGSISLNLGNNALLMGQDTQTLEELRGTGTPTAEDGLPSSPEIAPLPSKRRMECSYLVKGAEALEIVVSHPLAGTERTVSKPPQGLRPPSFESGVATPVVEQAPTVPEDDPFEEAFPSFEELYNEPAASVSPSVDQGPPRRPEPALPPMPPPSAAPPSPTPPPPAQRQPEPSFGGEFNIPDPAAAKPVRFGSLDEPTPEQKSGPFPSKKPSQGRVFGSPPQKPTGGLPTSLGGAGTSPKRGVGTPQTSESEFSPLPLVKKESPSSAFEPLIPTKAPAASLGEAETIGGSVHNPPPPSPPPPPSQEDLPAKPPARLGRSAPQLLRRQRGAQKPREPFKRS